jgi:hypothetical protein
LVEGSIVGMFWWRKLVQAHSHFLFFAM